MGDEVLSQDEVESLLRVMETSPAPGPGSAQRSPAGRSPERVAPYDFKRPERVGKEQMRGLQSLHEGFSRNFGAALSGLLRTIVEVKLTSVDQLTYSEFVFSLDNPTCFNLLKAESLEGHLIVDINPSILFPIIDRLLGGGRDSSPPAKRPLTEIELRLVSRVTQLFHRELSAAWEGVQPLKLSVDRVVSNPHLVQIVPPNEVVVLLGFEVSIGDVRGPIHLCIPFNSLERIATKLSENNWTSYGGAGGSQEQTAQISRQLGGAVVELVATLASTRISTADLLGLRVGDIITTEKDVHEPLVMAVEGRRKFSARPGAFKGHKAVEIDAPLDDPGNSDAGATPEA